MKGDRNIQVVWIRIDGKLTVFAWFFREGKVKSISSMNVTHFINK